MFPLATPSINLDKNNKGIFLVIIPKEKIKYAKNLTDKQKRRIFFLPNLSENSPKIDVEKNCPRGKIAVKSPSRIYP
jgi:hypothetical protein